VAPGGGVPETSAGAVVGDVIGHEVTRPNLPTDGRVCLERIPQLWRFANRRTFCLGLAATKGLP